MTNLVNQLPDDAMLELLESLATSDWQWHFEYVGESGGGPCCISADPDLIFGHHETVTRRVVIVGPPAAFDTDEADRGSEER